jgi:hypothetical protein
MEATPNTYEQILDPFTPFGILFQGYMVMLVNMSQSDVNSGGRIGWCRGPQFHYMLDLIVRVPTRACDPQKGVWFEGVIEKDCITNHVREGRRVWMSE